LLDLLEVLNCQCFCKVHVVDVFQSNIIAFFTYFLLWADYLVFHQQWSLAELVKNAGISLVYWNCDHS
jgi:hypothetical protein